MHTVHLRPGNKEDTRHPRVQCHGAPPSCHGVGAAMGHQLMGYNGKIPGEVDERFKSHAWKACVG